MVVTYLTEKTFPNGEKILKLKNSYVYKYSSIKRKVSKAIKDKQKKELVEEYNSINTLLTTKKIERQKEKIELQLNNRNLDNVRRSVQRTKQELYDILKCNDFEFFLTVTFDKNKIDRLDDIKTRREWTRWSFNFKRRFPNAYYVAVPEYHDNGGLHFHILVGGCSLQDFNPVHAYDKKHNRYLYVTKGVCKGDKIYNVLDWSVGFSTLTVIKNKDACRHYVAKYISKQWCDDRFFGKKRYYASRNIIKPVVEKVTVLPHDCDVWEVPLKYQIDYIDPLKQYGVFTYKPPKKYDFYGFFEDSEVCRVSLPKGRSRLTIRKSLLSKFSVYKKSRELQKGDNPFKNIKFGD